MLSGLLALAGGLVHGDFRVLLWACAVAVDLLGGAAGFYTPGLGRSRTADWTIGGGGRSGRRSPLAAAAGSRRRGSLAACLLLPGGAPHP